MCFVDGFANRPAARPPVWRPSWHPRRGAVLDFSWKRLHTSYSRVAFWRRLYGFSEMLCEEALCAQKLRSHGDGQVEWVTPPEIPEH